jgi:hypothetical protein
MTLNDLPHFSALFKAADTYCVCPSPTLGKFRGVLPEILLASWEQFGFQRFGDGFLWSVNPDEFRDLVSVLVYPEQVSESHVLFRTGFGDLLIEYRSKLIHFSAATLHHGRLAGTLDQVLDIHLGERDFANSIFFLKQFNVAKRKLGPPAESEVYGVELGKPLGGDFAVDRLQRLDLNEHLRLLAKLAKPKAP